jgi:hypothetical protein
MEDDNNSPPPSLKREKVLMLVIRGLLPYLTHFQKYLGLVRMIVCVVILNILNLCQHGFTDSKYTITNLVTYFDSVIIITFVLRVKYTPFILI